LALAQRLVFSNGEQRDHFLPGRLPKSGICLIASAMGMSRRPGRGFAGKEDSVSRFSIVEEGHGLACVFPPGHKPSGKKFRGPKRVIAAGNQDNVSGSLLDRNLSVLRGFCKTTQAMQK
jgi:hypothetical protein